MRTKSQPSVPLTVAKLQRPATGVLPLRQRKEAPGESKANAAHGFDPGRGSELSAQEQNHVVDGALADHIKRLRAKLGRSKARIQTLRGVGYRFASGEDEESVYNSSGTWELTTVGTPSA